MRIISTITKAPAEIWLKLFGILILAAPIIIMPRSAYALEFRGTQLRGLNFTGGPGTGEPLPEEPLPEEPLPEEPPPSGSIDPKLEVHHVGWYENIYPRAMHHNGKTHAVYHCYNYDSCLRTYDHKNKRWENPIRVGSNTIGGFENSHGNPAVLVDRTGQVHVFYGAQQTALKYSRTTVAGDTRTLSAQAPIGDTITYPQPLELSDGTIYLFHRSAGHGEDFTLRTSSNGGKSWSAASPLIEAPGVWYGFASKGQDDKIHAVFHLYNTAGSANYPREDIYYMYRNPQDGNWYNINNQRITLPITSIAYAEQNLKIYDSNGFHTDLDRVRETSNGYMYIGWIEDRSYKFLIHNGSKFEPVRALTFPDEPVLNQADFDIEDSWRIKLYLSLKGGEIALYESTDQAAHFTRKIAQLSGSALHAQKVRVPIIIDNHAPDAELIYYTAFEKNKYTRVPWFVWGDGGYIMNQEP